jgi:hypothetical protein
MNFNSFKYYGYKSFKSNFNFTKSTLRMMSCSVNMSSKRFISFMSNKIHYVSRIKPLNEIAQKGVICISGNGSNLYSDPELATTSEECSIIGQNLLCSGLLARHTLIKSGIISNLISLCKGKILFNNVEQLCRLSMQLKTWTKY